ncbi:MAG TPA: hypothetical protein VF084_03790 [Nitrososphaeraceae archaeon]|jgi:plastocyanin
MFLGLLSICVLSVLVFNSIAYSYAQEINSESTTGTSKNDGTVYIDINERGDFVPKEVKVKIGQTVTWTNKGSSIHTVTSGDVGCCPSEPGDAGKYFDSDYLANRV